MRSSKDFGKGDLSEEEDERFLAALVRDREDAQLRHRWAAKLADEHDVTRQDKPAAVRRLLPRLLIYSAGIAAAIALLVILLPSSFSEPGSELVAARIDKIELITTRSTGGDRSVDVKGREAEARYNAALTSLREGREEEAIKILTSLTGEASPLRIEATYYAALAELNLGRKEAGLSRLRNIPQRGAGRFYALAQQLLEADWDD